MTRPQNWVDNLKPGGIDGARSISAERQGSFIDCDALANHVLGAEHLERQERILNILKKDKLFSKEKVANLSRPERYMLGLARGKRMRQLYVKHGWSYDDQEMAKFLVDEISPYQVHNSMFRQTLREQTNDSQRSQWLSKAENWEIVGAYGQTELGHGSNVQGIETTATWDQNTKQFVLHSPYLTAAKWWNGSLGLTANHAIIVAQLMLPDPAIGGKEVKSYGPHPFFVQIRDLKTHKPLDGVVVGDIGPKFGYAPMDNAYLLMDNLRVPHEALLARYVSVDPQTGAYKPPENRAVIYGSLTNARMKIVMAARLILARAVTVAVRYCSVRRQFQPKGQPSAAEMAVLDYPTVQIRLFPLLATVFALHYSGKYMDQVYTQTRSDVESNGNLSALGDLHALSSGLKSLSTELACNGMETSRRTMGGHGYGGGTGLAEIFVDYTAKPTVEGDNWMITQQMARYLVKKAKLIVETPTLQASNHTEQFLSKFYKQNKNQLQSPKPSRPLDIENVDADIVEAFERRAAFFVTQSEYLLVYHFHQGLITDHELPEPTKGVMWQLFRLFALFTMSNKAIDFIRAGAVGNDQLNNITDNTISSLMLSIRPHAIKLVDSFKFPDYLLNSALGRYDGRVYEDLFNRAHRLNPLNKFTFNPNYWEDEIVHGTNDGGQILSKL